MLGFLVAAAVVMFGAIGELATIVLFGTSADYVVSLPLALIFPLIAGIILATYSLRTMIYVLDRMTKSPPAAHDDKAAPNAGPNCDPCLIPRGERDAGIRDLVAGTRTA